MDGQIGCASYNNGKILLVALFTLLFEYCIFRWTRASGKIELSERYVKKVNCGYTPPTHDTVVL